jgi:hypothetical protein
MMVGFSYSNKILSRIIRIATRAECSHCYILDPDAGLVFHAQGMTVNAVSYENFKKKNVIVWESGETGMSFSDTDWNWLRNQLGKPYGTATLIGHILPLLINKSNPFNDSDYSFTCSELVARWAGIKNAERARPDQLLAYLRDGKPLTL